MNLTATRALQCGCNTAAWPGSAASVLSKAGGEAPQLQFLISRRAQAVTWHSQLSAWCCVWFCSSASTVFSAFCVSVVLFELKLVVVRSHAVLSGKIFEFLC